MRGTRHDNMILNDPDWKFNDFHRITLLQLRLFGAMPLRDRAELSISTLWMENRFICKPILIWFEKRLFYTFPEFAGQIPAENNRHPAKFSELRGCVLLRSHAEKYNRWQLLPPPPITQKSTLWTTVCISEYLTEKYYSSALIVLSNIAQTQESDQTLTPVSTMSIIA